MSIEKIFRKKQRAALNSIREACVYQSRFRITSTNGSLTAIAIELQENGFRDLDEIKSLIIKFDQSTLPSFENENQSFSLELEQENEVLILPVTFIGYESFDKQIWTFSIQNAHFKNRRKVQRETESESFFVPILIYTKSDKDFPISAFARILDFDQGAIGIELRIPANLDTAKLIEMTLAFQEGVLPTEHSILPIHLVRNTSITSTQDGNYNTAIVVSKLPIVSDLNPRKLSLIQPKHEMLLKFRVYSREPMVLSVTLIDLTLGGLTATAETSDLKKLPRYFVAEFLDAPIRFKVSKSSSGLEFRLASTSLGVVTQWYNYLTSSVLHYHHRFRPEDAKEVTRLMLESGNYSKKAMANLVLLHGYLEFKWPLEEALPKTKYRWLVRDGSGKAIGHTSGLRVSESLWAAIDNIGSQNYGGSWNSEFVSKWIRVFIELLNGHRSNPLVQWTFSPAAGVWTKFDKRLEEAPHLVYCRDRIWSVFFSNAPETRQAARNTFTAEELGSQHQDQVEWLTDFGLSKNKFLDIITKGIYQGSAFCLDFEHDYAQPFRRYFYLLKRHNNPAFLLTFSNYPDWASLNKTHNWEYLFPIGDQVPLTEIEEFELLSIVKEIVFNANCTPFRMGIISKTFKMSFGNEWTNLILYPQALEFAAETLDLL